MSPTHVPSYISVFPSGHFSIDLKDQLQRTLGSSFTIERELGGGGMSRVFVARDESLGRDVVVKVLAPELAEGLSTERFTREIRLAAALQEPHIVPVLNAGQTAEGLPYYTMPFVRGESLRHRISAGPLPLDESISILRDVARALAYAHRQGIVHRDIKPENILLSEGTAVVTDFGIAKALEAARTEASHETLTRTGTSIGSPRYMAPEQAAADPSTDQRADIYAWGLVAYELITGQHPFADKTSPQQMLTAQMSTTPPPITAAKPGTPRPLAALVMRCLSKEPSGRPANGTELVAALNAPAAARYQRKAGRAAAAKRAIAAVVVVAAIASAALIWRARSASASEPPLIAVLPFETEGIASDPTFADGLGDAVTGKLARLAGLRVIDRKSVLSLASAAGKTAQQAGKSLGAEYVLRASVRWANGADGKARVRVSPSLVRVSDGTTTWSGDPEIVSPADPFTIQATVATHVAEALDVAMGARERTRLAMRSTGDTAAFAAVVLGKRIVAENSTFSDAENEKALRQFERAYALDPHYADALGYAAYALSQLGQNEYGMKFLDSSAVLAHRALAIDPTQPAAVNALTVRALTTDRPDEAVGLVQRAVSENPSNVALLTLREVMLMNLGDSAGAWDTKVRLDPLAPGSPSVVRNGFRLALNLRRYSDAAEMLARWRALDSTALSPMYNAAKLAEALGDTAGVQRAVQVLRAHGGNLSVTDGDLLRHGGAALSRELEFATLASYPPGSHYDTATFFAEKASLFMARGELARARAAADSGYPAMQHLANDPHQTPFMTRVGGMYLAWIAALRDDRPTALAAVQRSKAWQTNGKYPNSLDKIAIICLTAQIYGALDDVDSMLPYARRCFTAPNGYSKALLNEPEFARHFNDPRVRAIAEGKTN